MATVNLSNYKPLQITSADSYRIGIVVSDWNDFVTYNLRDAAIQILEKEGVKKENIEVFSVPGAFELNYACMQLCAAENHDAVIAIGNVIRGETPHFDFVCQGVTYGISKLNTRTENCPIIFGVLTTNTLEQAQDRAGGKHGNKGVEAAITAIKMANIIW